MTFASTNPGKACKIAAAIGAEWVFVNGWQEARLNGRCVAYVDSTGYHVATAHVDVDTSTIIA